MHNGLRTLTIVTCVSIALCGAASAQEINDEASNLAKAAQNPLAAMTTLPLQFNWNTGAGEYDRTAFNLNVQPVNLLLGYYTNSEHSEGTADTQVRFQINFLFPHRTK